MDEELADGLAGKLTAEGHELVQRVYFEDTDFSGCVYHARYMQFMERGRSDYLRLLGVHHRALAEEGLAFVVSRMAIDFRKPATIDDVLTVRSTSIEARGARIVLEQKVLRGAETLVTATVTVVLVAADGRPARLPANVQSAFGKVAVKP